LDTIFTSLQTIVSTKGSWWIKYTISELMPKMVEVMNTEQVEKYLLGMLIEKLIIDPEAEVRSETLH